MLDAIRIDDFGEPLTSKHKVEDQKLDNNDDGPCMLASFELVFDVEAEGEENGTYAVSDFLHVLWILKIIK